MACWRAMDGALDVELEAGSAAEEDVGTTVAVVRAWKLFVVSLGPDDAVATLELRHVRVDC